MLVVCENADTHLVLTLYIIKWHGSPATLIRSWISRSLEPKLLPSIVIRVPPSSGPELGRIWLASGAEFGCIGVGCL